MNTPGCAQPRRKLTPALPDAKPMSADQAGAIARRAVPRAVPLEQLWLVWAPKRLPVAEIPARDARGREGRSHAPRRTKSRHAIPRLSLRAGEPMSKPNRPRSAPPPFEKLEQVRERQQQRTAQTWLARMAAVAARQRALKI